MNANSLKLKNDVELKMELLAFRRAQIGFRIQRATQQSSDVSQAKKIRKNIARIKTILRERAGENK